MIKKYVKRKFKNGDYVAGDGNEMVVSTERGSGGPGMVFCDYLDEEGDVCYGWFQALELSHIND